MRYQIIFLFLFFFVCSTVQSQNGITQLQNTISVILDTDMGNDVDDALALDMLYKYQDQGRMNILGIMNNKDSNYAPEFIDIMNTWYGYPHIPIGTLKGGGVTIDDYVNYAENVCKLELKGHPMFNRTLSHYDDLLPAQILYRKLLAQQPDSSVVVISIGFSTNIARLLATQADEYSPLTGRELVGSKVKLLSVMAGDFAEKPRKEFNIVQDISSAQVLFAEWPTPIIVSPFAVGRVIQYPAKSIQNDFDWGVKHPMVEAYLHYRPMPYNRATWDLTSVLYVAEPNRNFFTRSAPGIVSVTKDGFTVFEPQSDGLHSILSVDSIQASKIRDYFVDLITRKPANLSR